MSERMAVILAAGEGKRLGAGIPKALLEFEKGRSFLHQVAAVLSKASFDPLAVIGASAEEVRAHHPELRLVENPRWREGGQLSSALLGLRAALSEGAKVILVHPVDMPFVRSGSIKELVGKLDDADCAVPQYEGASGHPLVLTRAAAEQILAMEQPVSLEAALQKLNLKRVPTKDPGVLLDVNTPEAHQRLLDRAPRRAPPPKRRKGASANAELDSTH